MSVLHHDLSFAFTKLSMSTFASKHRICTRVINILLVVVTSINLGCCTSSFGYFKSGN